MDGWRIFVKREDLVVSKKMTVSWPVAIVLSLVLSLLFSGFYAFYTLISPVVRSSDLSFSSFLHLNHFSISIFFTFLFILGLLFVLRELVLKFSLDFAALISVGFLTIFLAVGTYLCLSYFSGSDILSFDLPDCFHRYYGLEVFSAQNDNSNQLAISSQKLLLHLRNCPSLKSEQERAKGYFQGDPVKVIRRGFLTWQAAAVSGFTLHNQCLSEEKRDFFREGLEAYSKFAFYFLSEYVILGLFYFFFPLILFQLFFFFFTKKHIWLIRG